MPSEAEWSSLHETLSNNTFYRCNEIYYSTIAKALAASSGWINDDGTCSVGNAPENNNLTGFSAVPAGYYDYVFDYNQYVNQFKPCMFNYTTIFWTSTQMSLNSSQFYAIYYNSERIESDYSQKRLGASVRCIYDESVIAIPTVNTAAVSDVTYTTATIGGNVTAEGEASVSARGVCWSTSEGPTLSDNFTSDGIGTGEFVSTLTNLIAGTTYYARAYATNAGGTAYGEVVSFTTLEPLIPTVSTNTVINVTSTKATVVCNVTTDGGATVTERGVCWSDSENPTTLGNHISKGAGMGTFSSFLTSLTPGVTYHVRAYATNSVGTAYGDQVSFTTLNSDSDTTHHADNFSCLGTPTVSDHEGNVYNTVQIGTQCWMRENMRCTTSPSTGTTILNSNPSGYSYTGKQAYFVNNDISNLSTYGLLYNWNAAIDTFCTSYGETSINRQVAVSVTFNGKRRGICPDGWHIPSNEEWNALDDYVSSQNNYLCNNNTSNTAKALASVSGWSSSEVPCSVGNIPENNNATGFSAVPVGMIGYDSFGITATFWASNQHDYDEAYYHYLEYDYAPFYYYYHYKTFGLSVRCLRD